MSERINGKTPDEIRKGLECCTAIENEPNGCPYGDDCVSCFGIEQLKKDALALINALMADLTLVCGSETINPCLVCSHYRTDWEKPGCELNGLACIWSWRGVQKNDQDRKN